MDHLILSLAALLAGVDASDVARSIGAVVVVLGIMILVHEWGHFIAAKSCGVRVEIFSIGMGPRLFGWRRGKTDYRLSALPLGGYVKMAGDTPGEQRSGAPDEFLSRPRWQRAVIALAGPTMNIVAAVVLMAGLLFVVGFSFPAYFAQPVNVVALPKGAPAAAAGLQAGDRIIEINGLKNPNWEQAENLVAESTPGTTLNLVVARGAEQRALTVSVTDPHDVTAALGYPAMAAVIRKVDPGLPADRAGLKPGDEILAVNGQPVVTWYIFTEAVRGSGGQPVRVRVRRSGQEVALELHPEWTTIAEGPPRWVIGVAPFIQTLHRSVGPLESMGRSIQENLRVAGQIFHFLGQVVQGKVSRQQLKETAGPLGIAVISGQAAKQGLPDLVALMAVISLNLAILNLLPIPILDGGHLLLLAIEGIRQRDLSIAVKERFVQVGFAFLLLIFALVMYNDVSRLVGRFR